MFVELLNCWQPHRTLLDFTYRQRQGGWRRSRHPGWKLLGTMFDSLSRLCYSRPFHFDARMKVYLGGRGGGCVSTIPGVCNDAGRRKAVFYLCPLFYSTKVACVGYLDREVAVWAWHSRYIAPPKSKSASTWRWAKKYFLAIHLSLTVSIWIYSSSTQAVVLSVWGQEIYFFPIFIFYACFGMLLKAMGESFLLSEDKPLTPNIDGDMALWFFRRRAQNTKIGRKPAKNGLLDPSFYFSSCLPPHPFVLNFSSGITSGANEAPEKIWTS